MAPVSGGPGGSPKIGNGKRKEGIALSREFRIPSPIAPELFFATWDCLGGSCKYLSRALAQTLMLVESLTRARAKNFGKMIHPLNPTEMVVS